MTDATTALRYTAFADAPGGGNPAGIVLDASLLGDAEMQAIAAEIGFAETAFITEQSVRGDDRRVRVRYFSPLAEVPFCGHATVATAVALAHRDGPGDFVFETSVGPVTITTATADGEVTASFTSVEPSIEPFGEGILEALLGLLSTSLDRLDPTYPPRVSFAGNRHPVLVFAERSEFDSFTFDPDAMRELMHEQGWTGTVTTVFPTGAAEFDSRNIFPVGEITEDPATGSAAAAFGAYLRVLGLVDAPTEIEITQGSHIGRPSRLLVHIPATGGIVVTGTATPIA
ncbi:PhzF family phenazine biosynthesis protein [Agreia bicolorata]|uniref:Phenazine biosynthesis protein PhzF n=1 Tax=Agreia bicolorata TaxID=110935 RepID=A0ABR5CGT6_9MICO|nr:PhzF family phenazine biosynthesis isomerase [Agreia bicolorata]KJC64832.1 phenazine biosynthesis protein PhzF [Agreia bicolorata]